MNGWFLAAGALLAAAFFVHVFSGNRFYSAARPDRPDARPGAYEAWLMGRCGVQMISVDLFLAAGFLLLSGLGLLPRSFWLEVFLLSVFGGWGVFWLVSLACEKAGGRITSGCVIGCCSSCCSGWCWAACSANRYCSSS